MGSPGSSSLNVPTPTQHTSPPSGLQPNISPMGTARLEGEAREEKGDKISAAQPRKHSNVRKSSKADEKTNIPGKTSADSPVIAAATSPQKTPEGTPTLGP